MNVWFCDEMGETSFNQKFYLMRSSRERSFSLYFAVVFSRVLETFLPEVIKNILLCKLFYKEIAQLLYY